MTMYKAEYADEDMEVFFSETEEDAIHEAFDYEEEHGCLFGLFEIDENYDEVKAVL